MSATILTLAAPQALFDQFYNAYPRKIGRKDAMRAWGKLTPEQKQKAVDTIAAHVRYWNASETEKTYIPYPSTFLNGWRFDDELDPVKPATASWWTTEQLILDEAQKEGISSHGKQKQQLIDEIRAAKRR